MKKAFNKLRALYRSMSLGARFAAVYCLAGLLPLLITNTYASTTLNATTRDNQMLAAEQGYDQAYSFLSEKLYRILRINDVIALDESLNACLYAHDPDNYTMREQINDRAIILKFLAQKRDDLDIYNVNLYVRDEWIYSHSSNMIHGILSIEDQEWYKRLTQSRGQALFCPPSYLPDSDMLSIARPVRNLQNLNHIEAILRIDFPLSEVEQILKRSCTVKGSVSFLVNEEGALVAASADELPDIPDMDEIIRNAWQYGGFFEIPGDPDILLQCKQIRHTDWLMITTLSKSAILEVNRQAWLGVLITLFVVMLPTLFFARYMIRGMSSRLGSLETHMRNVQLGELKSTRTDPNRDEIGRMTGSYNFMIDRISSLLEEQYRIGKEARSAELLALQSQINPHFLYNTLEMINWMAKMDQTKPIQTVVEALADFYRLSLSKGEDAIPIRDELQLVESYMVIQRMRFGEHIVLSIDVDEAIFSALIPKITLQPLVENALLHGILPMLKERGTIRITGGIAQGEGWLSVCDDGIGIPTERLPDLLHPTRLGGYGLNNIDKRLCLYFNRSSCLSFHNIEGGGLEVMIRFPIQ